MKVKDIQLPITLEQLFILIDRCKTERMSVNAGTLTQEGEVEDEDTCRTWYGQPTLVIMDAAWNVIVEWKWDHTLRSIREAAEIAVMSGGWVSVTYPIIVADATAHDSGKPIDEGFEIQVYPKFCLRAHNSWVDVSMDEEEV